MDEFPLITNEGRIFFPQQGGNGKLVDPNGNVVVPGERGASNIKDDVNKSYKDGTGKTDWNTLLTTGGGALLAYALASSLVDKPYGERKKDSMWMKVLRALIPVGAGVAGGVAGHYLGTKMAEDNNSSSNSTAKASSKANGNPGTVNVQRNWLADLADEADDWQMPYYLGGGAMGLGGLAELAFGAKRGVEYAKGTPHTSWRGKDVKDWKYLEDMKSEIEAAKANEAAQANYKAQKAQWDKSVEAYNKDLQQWQNATQSKAKGAKAPVYPTEPAAPAPYTGKSVADAEAAYRKAVGKRAIGHGAAGVGLLGAGALSWLMGSHNAQQVDDLSSQIRQIFIDNNRMGDYERLKQMYPDLPLK